MLTLSTMKSQLNDLAKIPYIENTSPYSNLTIYNSITSECFLRYVSYVMRGTRHPEALEWTERLAQRGMTLKSVLSTFPSEDVDGVQTQAQGRSTCSPGMCQNTRRSEAESVTEAERK